jgi:hypothetical protein
VALDDLRYDQVAFRGVHNSIDKRFSVVEQLEGSGGVVGRCTALELDLHQAPDAWTWEVKHLAGDEPTPLDDVLDDIVGWSDANPGHRVVTVHLDLKNAPMGDADFARELDRLLVDAFGAGRIYAPGDVIGDQPDLVRAAKAGGWATMAELEGRFVFCLSGNGGRKKHYSEHDPKARRCFADFPGSRGPSRRGHRVFANLFCEAHHFRENLRRLVRRAGFITRAYAVNQRGVWDTAMEEGLNIVSSDELDEGDLSMGMEGCRALGVGRGVG